MLNPFVGLPDKAFWKTAVGDRNFFNIDQVWDPKFDLRPEHKIVTFGSCFAQHIGRALSARGYTWLDGEPAPKGLSPQNAKRFNFGLFSARTGNIYTTSLLRQWARWATGRLQAPDEVWIDGKQVFDPFRPRIEPDGFDSADEMKRSRDAAVRAFRRCIEVADYFVFTLGLTESWINADTEYEYPMCPGTAAGMFDSQTHIFKNQSFNEILFNLNESIELIQQFNENLRFILTVSPVPLTATNSGQHVLVATMASKSILRAVAAETAATNADVDYFPSYELISSPAAKGCFFEPNQRGVSSAGVEFVMDIFFRALNAKYGESHTLNEKFANIEQSIGDRAREATSLTDAIKADDVICEEELLSSFKE